MITQLKAGGKSDFLKANELYSQKDYDQALDIYKGLINEGMQGSNLYYNIGNAYFKTGDWLHALLYFEKSALLNPSNDDVQHNILFANKYVVDEFEVHPSFGKRLWLNSIMSSNTAAWLSILFLMVALTCFYFFFKNKSRNQMTTSLVGLGLFLLFAIYSSYLKSVSTSHDYALIMKSSVKVKSEPGSGEQLFIIHEGTKVQVLEELSDWAKIKLPDGNVGWVMEEKLGLI